VISAKSSFDPAVPDDLAERDQWLLWRRESVNGKETKVPNAVTGHRASSTNPGIGPSFTGQGKPGVDTQSATPDSDSCSPTTIHAGLDLDDCLDENGSLKPWAHGCLRAV